MVPKVYALSRSYLDSLGNFSMIMPKLCSGGFKIKPLTSKLT